MDWLDLLAVQGTLKSSFSQKLLPPLPTHQAPEGRRIEAEETSFLCS